jgi:hypothetical protein
LNAKKIPGACDDRDAKANSEKDQRAPYSATPPKSQSKRYGIVDFEDDLVANQWGVRLAAAADEFRASRRRPGRGRQ